MLSHPFGHMQRILAHAGAMTKESSRAYARSVLPKYKYYSRQFGSEAICAPALFHTVRARAMCDPVPVRAAGAVAFPSGLARSVIGFFFFRRPLCRCILLVHASA